jgi:hypothetical protein
MITNRLICVIGRLTRFELNHLLIRYNICALFQVYQDQYCIFLGFHVVKSTEQIWIFVVLQQTDKMIFFLLKKKTITNDLIH